MIGLNAILNEISKINISLFESKLSINDLILFLYQATKKP